MIGNDVVDLTDAETQAGATHPRFDARVFAPAERAALAASDAPQRLRWCLWACKESAYKAARQLDARVVFAPSQFVVALDATGAHGIVHHPVGLFPVSIEHGTDFVHALAVSHPVPVPAGERTLGALPKIGRQDAKDAKWIFSNLDFAAWRPNVRQNYWAKPTLGSDTSLPLLFAVAPAGADPSTSARRLAIHALARALDADPGALAITRRGRVPQLELHGIADAAALSLSHHGRFVAFACAVQALPKISRQDAKDAKWSLPHLHLASLASWRPNVRQATA